MAAQAESLSRPSGAPWGRAAGRATSLAYAAANAVAVAAVLVRVPAGLWPLLLPYILFESAAAAFAVVQAPARAYARTVAEVVVPVVSTWLLPVVGVLLHPPAANLGRLGLVVGLVVSLTYAWLLWAIMHLRRNFSILPEVRSLVRTGPYALVRHPLYVGYTALAALIVVGSPSPAMAAAAAVAIALFWIRARMEERRLVAEMPGYANYFRQGAGFQRAASAVVRDRSHRPESSG